MDSFSYSSSSLMTVGFGPLPPPSPIFQNAENGGRGWRLAQWASPSPIFAFPSEYGGGREGAYALTSILPVTASAISAAQCGFIFLLIIQSYDCGFWPPSPAFPHFPKCGKWGKGLATCAMGQPLPHIRVLQRIWGRPGGGLRSHINLPGHGLRNQRRAIFLQ